LLKTQETKGSFDRAIKRFSWTVLDSNQGSQDCKFLLHPLNYYKDARQMCIGLIVTTEIRTASILISNQVVKARNPNHLIFLLNQSLTQTKTAQANLLAVSKKLMPPRESVPNPTHPLNQRKIRLNRVTFFESYS